MGTAPGIAHELSLGEVVSKTFELYKKNLAEYLILFAIVEGAISLVTFLVKQAIALPSIPVNPTAQQFNAWFFGFALAAVSLLGVTAIVSLVLVPVAEGAAVKMASEEIEKGTAELSASVRFALSKLLRMWALTIIVGVIVVLGFIALIVPGIILGIMFSLALPVLLIENKGVGASMSRSRELVGHRWLKTFGLYIIMGLILVVVSTIITFISAPFGTYSPIVSGVLSAAYQPLIPITLAVYYYSNAARITPPPPAQPPVVAPAPVFPVGAKFCPSCGTQMDASSVFCPKCGAKQPG